jgi:hypothetical protein
MAAPERFAESQIMRFDETISADAASHHNAAERRKTGLTVARTAVERRSQGALMRGKRVQFGMRR